MIPRAVAWLAALWSAAAVVCAGWIWALLEPDSLPSLSHPRDAAVVLGWGCLGIAWTVVGGLLVTARPRNAVGWLLLGIGACQAAHVGLTAYGLYGATVAEPSWPAALWVGYAGSAFFVVGTLITPTLLVALYPEGRLPAWWWRVPIAVTVVAVAHIAADALFLVVGDSRADEPVLLVPDFLQGIPPELMFTAASPYQPVWSAEGPLPGWVSVVRDGYLPQTAQLWLILFVVSTVVIWAGAVMRLARAKAPQRQQLAWLVCVVMPMLAASWFAPGAGLALTLATMTLVPMAVAVGVLRYRLLGIDTVLRRGLVYGALTVLVVVVYLAVTTLAGTALDQKPLPGVVAAALVAVSLSPLRDWLQRIADRLVYGDRRDPLQAVAHLGQRLSAVGERDLLPAALLSVADAVRAPGAAVVDPDGRTLATIGTQACDGDVIPLGFGGDRIGSLHVAAQRPHGRYIGPEARLLASLAPQLAVVVRARQLTEALESERDRVLAATTSERNRLRHDLHDGLGPSLSGVGLGLQALADTVDKSDARTVDLVDRLRLEVGLAVNEIRRIIDGLRPASLDSLGLVGAIRQHAATLSAAIPVAVDADDVSALSSDIETAAYRITAEALTNAVRHANATQIRVGVTMSETTLYVRVIDNGEGTGAATPGVGIASMRRRAESLRGTLIMESGPTGTTVTATIPVENP